MKKYLSMMMVLALCLFALAACGGDEETPAPAESQTQTEETAPADTQTEDAAPADTQTEDAAPADAQDSGAEADVSAIVGSWVSGTWVSGENSYDPDEWASAHGVTAQDILTIYTFNENGTVVAMMAGQQAEGTYTFDGENIVTTFPNGASVTFMYNANEGVLGVDDPSIDGGIVFARYNQ